MLANVSVFCFLASYAVAFGLELTRFLRLTTFSRVVQILFGGAGLVAHTAYLFVRSGQTNLPPLLSSTHDWLLVLAWMAVVFYLFLTSLDRELAVGLFLLPLVLATVGAAYLVSDQPNPLLAADPGLHDAATRGWAMLHVSLLVFGMAGTLCGLMLGMMYLVQHRRLKRHRGQQRGLTLPSLEKLARLNWWAVIGSVPLLTLGLAAGLVLGLLSDKAPGTIAADPFVFASGIVWSVMMVLFVWLLLTDRPAGRQVAWMTVWACGFLLVTLIGLQVVTGRGGLPVESWHSGVWSGRDAVAMTEPRRHGDTESGRRSGPSPPLGTCLELDRKISGQENCRRLMVNFPVLRFSCHVAVSFTGGGR